MSRGGRQDERGDALEPAGGDLVDLLYGELDGEAERSLRARVAADSALAERLADMSRVREVFSSLPDEEPPSSLTAQLLSQAAQAAQGSRRAEPDVRPGLWSKLRAWLQPISAHPGLAAAASIVVVVGVASALLVRKGEKLTQAPGSGDRAAMSEAVRPAAEDPAPAGGQATAPAALESPSAPPAPTAASESPSDERGAAAGSTGQLRGEAEEVARESRRDRVPRPARAKKAEPLPLRDGYDADAKAPSDLALGMAEREVSKQSQGQKSKRRSQGMSKPIPAPSSAAGGSAANEASGDAPILEGEESAAQRGPSAQPPAAPTSAPATPAELHRRAVAAAADRRCLEVQSLEQEIRRVDPAYHERAVRADKRLASCLAAKRAK